MARWHLSYFGVSSFVVIELDVFIDHFIKVNASVGRVEIYLFIFDGLPETFYVNVVQGPSPAVHGDLDFMVLKNCDILVAGILGALVGVVYFRWAALGYSIFEQFYAPLLIH